MDFYRFSRQLNCEFYGEVQVIFGICVLDELEISLGWEFWTVDSTVTVASVWTFKLN